jgi:tetratricopeptide (TPR) repeat protein
MRLLLLVLFAAACCFAVMAALLGLDWGPPAVPAPAVNNVESIPSAGDFGSAESPLRQDLLGELSVTKKVTLESVHDSGQHTPEYISRRQAYAAAFAKGDFAAVIQDVEEMLRQYPADGGLKSDLATALLASGIEAYEHSNYDRALDQLRRAVDLGNERARGAYAKVLVLKGHKAEARQILEAEYQTRPGRSVLEALVDLSLSDGSNTAASRWLDEYEQRFLLGSGNTRASRQGAAVQAVQTPLGVAPGEENPAAVEAARSFFESRQRRASAQQRFDETGLMISRDELQVRFVSPLVEPLAERVLERLLGLVEVFRLRFGATTWGARFDVELVEKKGFSDATGAPPWAGAIFDGTMRIPYPPTVLNPRAESVRVERIAVHEFTHAYLYSLCGEAIPSWLGEGLAQLAEGRDVQAAKMALKSLLGSDWQRQAPFRDLDSSFVQESDATRVRQLYMASLYLTGQLERIRGEGVWRRLINAACSGGRTLPDAMEVELGARTTADLWLLVTGSRP